MRLHVLAAIPAVLLPLLPCAAQAAAQNTPPPSTLEQIEAAAGLPFHNPALPIEQRVDDLVSRLTLEEKVSQLIDRAAPIWRLDVSAYDWWNEGLHSIARSEYATLLPQAIGNAATWDAPLMNRIGTVVSSEACAKYNDAILHDSHGRYFGLTIWSPSMNIFRDPRWARGQETYGEDPFLISRLGVAFVQGIQGDDPTYFRAIATPKRYAVHSGPESTRHKADIDPSEHDLRDTYLPAFRATIVEGKAASIVCAYNAVDKSNLEAWYPGQSRGQAIVDTLNGRNNPGGRLPVTFYTGINQLPPLEDHSMAKRNYRYFTGKSLYSFGDGLSYTSFNYSNLCFPDRNIRAGHTLTVEVDVESSGSLVEGDEVAELYLTPAKAPISPTLALAGFGRLHLSPADTRHLIFHLDPRTLSQVNDEGVRAVAPGRYRVSPGGSQPGRDSPEAVRSGGLTIVGTQQLPR